MFANENTTKSQTGKEEENSRAQSTDKNEKQRVNKPIGTTIERSLNAEVKDFLLLKLQN